MFMLMMAGLNLKEIGLNVKKRSSQISHSFCHRKVLSIMFASKAGAYLSGTL
jgi:hypothetical protein